VRGWDVPVVLQLLWFCGCCGGGGFGLFRVLWVTFALWCCCFWKRRWAEEKRLEGDRVGGVSRGFGFGSRIGRCLCCGRGFFGGTRFLWVVFVAFVFVVVVGLDGVRFVGWGVVGLSGGLGCVCSSTTGRVRFAVGGWVLCGVGFFFVWFGVFWGLWTGVFAS